MDNRDGALALVPMTVTDLFDEALDLYKRDFALLAGIVAVVHVPAEILYWLASRWLDMPHVFRSYEAASADQQVFAALGAIVVSMVGMVAFAFVSVVEGGALTVAVSERYLGRPVTVFGAYRRVLRRGFALLATWAGISLALGFAWLSLSGVFAVIALIVGEGIGHASDTVVGGLVTAVTLVIGAAVMVVGVALSVYLTPIVVIEGTGYITAVQRNCALVKRRVFRVWGSLVLLIAAVAAIGAGVAGSLIMLAEGVVLPMLSAGPLTGEIVREAIEAVVTMFLLPVGLIYITLSYYDSRVRREGFDLALLEKQMRSAGGGGA